MKAAPTILVVEDMEDDVFFLKRALKGAGIANSLQVVVDGREAIHYLSGQGAYADRAAHPLPFLILLDLKLPYVMGLDVLKWIRQRPRFDSIVVAVLSSSHQQSDLSATGALGGNSYIVKPPTAQKIAQLMAEFPSDSWRRHGSDEIAVC